MKDAAGIDDANRLELFWLSKKREVDASIADYEKTMRGINLIDLASLFKVSVPTGVTTAIAFGADWMGATAAAALTGAAFAVDVAGVLGNRLFRKQSADQRAPWLYALRVRERFGPH